MIPRKNKNSFRLLVGIAVCWVCLWIGILFPIQASDYAITVKAPFNQVDYYPISQTLDSSSYLPTGQWVGRLLLPTEEDVASSSLQDQDWVWLEVYQAPESSATWIGQKVRLTWDQDLEELDFIRLVTVDINFSEATKKSEKAGNLVPTRLNGRKHVGPLQSLAGARPLDDVLVSFEQANVAAAQTLRLTQMPVLVPAPFYGLVKIINTESSPTPLPQTCPGEKPCDSEYFRVRHYNLDAGRFDGAEEIIRIPQQPQLGNGRFNSTPWQIMDSPVGEAGWYVYGAKNPEGIFTVRALRPRSLFQLTPDEVILGKEAGLNYIQQGNWQNTPERKGTAQRILVDPQAASTEKAIADWKEGDYGLLMHLFGGIGGENGESFMAGTVTGHFSYGLATVRREPLTNELEFDIKYYQVYAHNGQGILSGAHTWANYMGNLQRGWVATRPVADVILRLDVFNDDFVFGETIISPIQELLQQLRIMTSRYRTGDGTGNSSVTPATSCVQDSNQALYIALEELKRKVKENPKALAWIEQHADHPETQQFEKLISLAKTLNDSLSPQGVVRADWKQNAESLASVTQRHQLPFIKDNTLTSGLLSWRSMIPRSGFDTISKIFLDHDAQLWFLRTNQLGGWDPTIEPVAPTPLFGETAIISPVLRRILAATLTFPRLGDWLIALIILMVYGAIALPLGLRNGFLRWQKPIKKRLGWKLLLLLFSPALLEELVFRVMLLPYPSHDNLPKYWFIWAFTGLLLFILYHPLNALIFYQKARPVFRRPIFLWLCGLLGLACTVAYFLTGSLWIIVLIHWLVVVIWLFGLGGEKSLVTSKNTI